MGLLGTMTSKATKAATMMSVASMVDELMARYRSDSAWRAATARRCEVEQAGIRTNEQYQRAEGGTTASSPDVDQAVGRAHRAEAAARQAASESVRPGFVDLHQRTAAAMASALADVIRLQSDLAQIESSAQSCGVCLTTLSDALPDVLHVNGWRRQCETAGRS
jgi:hypothetical protein